MLIGPTDRWATWAAPARHSSRSREGVQCGCEKQRRADPTHGCRTQHEPCRSIVLRVCLSMLVLCSLCGIGACVTAMCGAAPAAPGRSAPEICECLPQRMVGYIPVAYAVCSRSPPHDAWSRERVAQPSHYRLTQVPVPQVVPCSPRRACGQRKFWCSCPAFCRAASLAQDVSSTAQPTPGARSKERLGESSTCALSSCGA